MTALKRVAKNTIEKRLLNSKGQPNFGLSFYCLNAKGEYAGRRDASVDATPSAPRMVRRRCRQMRCTPAAPHESKGQVGQVGRVRQLGNDTG